VEDFEATTATESPLDFTSTTPAGNALYVVGVVNDADSGVQTTPNGWTARQEIASYAICPIYFADYIGSGAQDISIPFSGASTDSAGVLATFTED